MARCDLLVAVGILRDSSGNVLLVGNDWSGQGRVRYTLPGGMVEEGELLPEGLCREITEETGLQVTGIGRMAYTVHIEDKRQRVVAVAFEVHWKGWLNPQDPDGFVVEAFFCSPQELAEKIDMAPIREPIVDYLLTGETGRFYAFKNWDGKSGLRIPNL